MLYSMVKGLSKLTTSSEKIIPDIMMLKFTVVNAFMVGDGTSWILIDTGLENSKEYIIQTAEEQFGKNNPPQAIILTHGHFDHVGAVKFLSEYWNVDVYIHEIEVPYVTGKKDYPSGNPEVDEGLVAKLSPSFPNESIDLGNQVFALPSEGRVPFMPEWEWIHTPGHTPGHISLFREKDRTLIVGDAFTTTKQESLTSVLSQREKIKGPPAYMTTDWNTAKNSVDKLKELEPKMVFPSHGKPMKEEELAKHLKLLSNHFDEISVPRDE